jgi:hypothetical protein
VKTYQLSAAAVDRKLHELATWGIPFAGLLPVVCVAVPGALLRLHPDEWLLSAGVAAGGLFILPFWAYIGAYRALREARSRFESYRVILDGDRVTCARPGRRDVTLLREDIASVTEVPGVGLRVRPADKWRSVLVLEELEDYDEVKRTLQGFAPQWTAARPVRMERIVTFVWLFYFCLAYLAVPRFVTDPSFLLAAAAVEVPAVAWWLWRMQSDPVYDVRSKGLAWILLTPVALFVLRIALTVLPA